MVQETSVIWLFKIIIMHLTETSKYEVPEMIINPLLD